MAVVNSLFIISTLILISRATTGVDVSSPISHWACLKEHGVEFAIVRAFQSTGHPDPNAASNIRHAKEAGIRHVDAYLFPCVPCGDARRQVRATVDGLKGLPYTTLWMDIEKYAWSSNKEHNRAFILDLLHEARSLGKKAGIYTNYYMWEEIVGLDWHGASAHPLWYAHYDGATNFHDFKPFGGWTRPTIKQYAGDKTLCSSSVDLNWYP